MTFSAGMHRQTAGPVSVFLPAIVVALLFAIRGAPESGPAVASADSRRSPTNREEAGRRLSGPLQARVRLISGRNVSGVFSSLDAKKLTIRSNAKTGDAAGRTERIPVADVLHVDFGSEGNERELSERFVYLANGDRLAVSPVKMDGEFLHGVWNTLPDRPSIRLPLLSVRGIVLHRPRGAREWSRLDAMLMSAPGSAGGDRLVLRNGDRLTGRLTSLDEDSVTMSGDVGKVSRKRVRAVVFDPRYVKKPGTLGPRTIVQLSDGTRLTVDRAVAATTAAMQVQTSRGTKLELPLKAIRSLLFLGKRVVPLSRRKPAAFEHTPYLDGKHPLRKDRNVLGGPLVLRGREYALGLGMHSRSRATWALSGDERHFLATVGVDDAAGGKGSVVFRVLVGGKAVFTSPVLTGKSKPLSVGPIPLKGHKRLTLIADFGPFGDLLDLADWCDAVLVK